jgi:uncharacterized alpha-E superfamily protein
MSKYQLKEFKRELWFQTNRIESELKILPEDKRKRLVGMQKSRLRLLSLLQILAQFEKDGVLELVDETLEGGMSHDDGASADPAQSGWDKGTVVVER